MTPVSRYGYLSLIALLLASACGDGDAPLDSSGTAPPPASRHAAFVTDAQGRALILHGLNVSGSAKDDPQRMPWIDRDQARRIAQDWGFNAVRFLIFWDAAEPAPGQYDDAYLDRVAERVDWLASAGLMVILDMHQDVYGKLDQQGKVLGFDGAPSWAAATDGLPHRLNEPWSLTYLEAGVRRVFDNFWSEDGAHADLQQHYINMWAHVAARFRGNPAVLGYDLMNEPFAGNAAGGDLGGIPFGNAEASAEFDRTKFFRFHQRAIAAIRAVDPDNWIFFEPLAFPANNGGASELPGLDDPRPGTSHLAYFPHLYAIVPEISNMFDPANTPEMDAWVGARPTEVARFAAPLLIGEFGLPWDGGGDPLGYLRKILDTADTMTSGWLYWSHDVGGWGVVSGADLHENPNVDVLVRAYPQRVAGRPIRYAYDAQQRRLDLDFVDAPGVSGPTEIYLPVRRFYPNGYHLEVSDPRGSWSEQWDAEREVLSIFTRKRQGVHSLHIRPADAAS